ncbi:MAG: hypothetical protein QXU13_00880 [Desulfurococcaceae archaeon]
MKLYLLGFTLIFIGVILAMVSAFLPLLFTMIDGKATIKGGDIDVKIGAGWCIVVFFIPICFGFGEYATLLMVLVIALAIVLVLTSYLLYRHVKKQTSYIASPG